MAWVGWEDLGGVLTSAPAVTGLDPPRILASPSTSNFVKTIWTRHFLLKDFYPKRSECEHPHGR
jgi:hypothetical protein